MPTTVNLSILYTESYNANIIVIQDASVYDVTPIYVPIITICIPGFKEKEIVFSPGLPNVFNSTTLGITQAGCEQELPDGIYKFTYCANLSNIGRPVRVCTTKSFFRINKIQEQFSNYFLTLEVNECDKALKAQELQNLNLINILIQSAIAAANNCSEKQAMVLYQKAKKLLQKAELGGCGCN